MKFKLGEKVRCISFADVKPGDPDSPTGKEGEIIWASRSLTADLYPYRVRIGRDQWLLLEEELESAISDAQKLCL